MSNFCQFGPRGLGIYPTITSAHFVPTKQVSTGFNIFTAVFKQSLNQVTPFWMVADPTGTGVLKDYTRIPHMSIHLMPRLYLFT